MAEVNEIRSGKNFAVGEAGPMEALDGKLFLGKALGFSGMEVSLNRFAPGQEVPFIHQHRLHEEMYLFIQGHGQFQVDGEVFDVQPGTIVRVLPQAKRAWRNSSADEDLLCVIVQANVESLTGQDGIRLDEPLNWPR